MINPEELHNLVKQYRNSRVLYVEDSQEAREQALKLYKNFFKNIDIAVNGQDGLDKFKSNKYDLIFADLNMPIMGGLEMIKYIREIDENIEIIVISAHNEIKFKEDSSKLGVTNYIVKPMVLEKFMELLSNLKSK